MSVHNNIHFQNKNEYNLDQFNNWNNALNIFPIIINKPAINNVFLKFN